MARMMDYVLPKYFKHRKYTSFQRQLNYFNFKKWTKSKAAVCTFSNDWFLRDEPDLSWRITRKKSMPSASSLPASKSSAASRKAATPTAAPQQPPSPHGYESPSWKKAQSDVAIVVPRTKSESHHLESFPSPTDMDMMLLDSETDVQRYYHGFATHPHEDSLDWIDNFLPSLEVPKIEDQYYYHSSLTIPSVLRPAQFQALAASYQSLPPPSSFGGCVL
jgi:hypothetical protein